jgi:hypothetical protein
MTDDELRALVRESVARHLGLTGGAGVAASHDGLPAGAGPHGAPMLLLRSHPSHYRYALPSSSDDASAGPCLIEPAVTCNHCGYCQSHGH